LFSSSAFFLPNYKHPARRKGPPYRLPFFPELRNECPLSRFSIRDCLEEEGSMSAWHQIASATTTIAFSILPVHGVADVRGVPLVRRRILHLARPEAAKRGVSRAARSLSQAGMPLAISLIVDGYVRLGDREALETLRAHRVGMQESARSIAEMDTSRMIATLKEEIEIVDAGLSRLNALREEQELAPAPLKQPSP
jgi:hypothetical protein